MPLPKFLQRAAAGPAPKKAGATLAADAPADDRSARHRLIGALVLLAVAVAVFSLVFDTEPRPLPMDTPMRAGEGAAEPLRPSIASPAPKAATSPSTADASPPPSLSELPKDTPAAGAAAEPPASAVAAPQEPVAEQAPSAPKLAAAASVANPAAAAPAAASKPAPAAAAEAGARYVIQVGAFSDAQALREARQRVERLGLKTYTQVVESGGATRTRVRVGPFASRDDAERARAKLQAAKLPANLLTL